MRYRVEVFYKNGTCDAIHYESYDRVVKVIKLVKLTPVYKDIRVYKLIGRYKNNENI